MRIVFAIFLLLGIALVACDKNQNNCSTIPDCIQALIDTNKASFCPSSKIDEYSFQSKTVYVFYTVDCVADGASCVFDISCKDLGCLGGFAFLSGENVLPKDLLSYSDAVADNIYRALKYDE